MVMVVLWRLGGFVRGGNGGRVRGAWALRGRWSRVAACKFADRRVGLAGKISMITSLLSRIVVL